jgi:hypothetical protein
MRYAFIGFCLAFSMAAGAESEETTPAESVPSPVASEEDADAEILDIEKSVSGADDVEEFVPKKPLSADKAIALPSDI